MSLEIFLFLLLVVSILTMGITEAIKTFKKESEEPYSANLIAGVVAVVLSIAIAAAYIIMMEATLTAKLAVYLIALMLFSWLGAMLGFDKVTQMILQIVNAAPGKEK